MVCGPITLGLFILLLVLFISINFKIETVPLPLPLIKSGFVGGMFELKKEDTPNLKCGVDLPSCKNNMRCVNGFCRTEDIPSLKETGLNIVP